MVKFIVTLLLLISLFGFHLFLIDFPFYIPNVLYKVFCLPKLPSNAFQMTSEQSYYIKDNETQ